MALLSEHVVQIGRGLLQGEEDEAVTMIVEANNLACICHAISSAAREPSHTMKNPTSTLDAT